jgi:hypothetical protein
VEFYEIVVSPNQNLYSSFFHFCIVFITSFLFIGFEHRNNESKVEEVNYEFGIASFLR